MMIKKDVHAVVRAFAKQYQHAKNKEKSELSHRLVKTTGYSRKHLMEILPNPPKVRKKKKRVQKSKYLQILRPLQTLWAVSNYACGQRLKPFIPSLIAALRRHKELVVTPVERQLLLQISSATIDRLLTHDKKRINNKGRSRTKPGSLLKHQIPIKTWRDWNNTIPGFVEIDSVHHCGGNHITYTRAREGISNDQPYIEQQNYSVVRRFVGYQRLDTEKQLERANKIYELLSDYQNFFQPIMRLKTKVRDGAKVTRKYDEPLTAYQRVLKRKGIPKETKQKPRKRYKKLNPKKLLLEITHLGKKLSER